MYLPVISLDRNFGKHSETDINSRILRMYYIKQKNMQCVELCELESRQQQFHKRNCKVF